MKTRNIITILTVIILGVFVLLSGCNMFGPESGMGKVTVHFSAGRAALSPGKMCFEYYQLTFHRNGDLVVSDVRDKDDLFTFDLETGSGYTLEVKAYVGAFTGSVVEANLAAVGTESFSVYASTDITVYLDGFLYDGPSGVFSYNILYPEDATINELTLRVSQDDNRDLLALLTVTPSGGMVSDSIELPAGRYFLIFRLSRDDGREIAGYANGVELMSGHTTYFGTGDAPVVFMIDDFDAVPDLPYVRVYEWREFNVDGLSFYYPNDRATNGRVGVPWSGDPKDWYLELDGNYDPSHAVGYRYESFTDGEGKTWDDVLLLVPPAENNPLHYRSYGGHNGYEEYTITLSYPITEKGKYQLSMWYQVEGGVEDVTVFWQNTGGINGNEKSNDPSCAEPWTTFTGNPSVLAERGKPLYLEGTIILRDQEEIGMLARSYQNGGGLKDASIYILDLVVEQIIPPVVEIETIRTWEDFEIAFDIPGAPGEYNAGSGEYYGSDADYDIVDYQGYENVLKLEINKEAVIVGGTRQVGMAMLFTVPGDGIYTLTMEVWIEQPIATGMPFSWYRCNSWNYIIVPAPLYTGEWVTYSGSMDLKKGDTLGLYTHYYDNPLNLLGATIYFRNFKLECYGQEDPIIEIECQPVDSGD